VNSLGCTPSIAASGTPSATATAGFVVSSSNQRNHKSGLLLYTNRGRAAAPFQGGTLCLEAPLKRSIALDSAGTPLPANDCSGMYSIDVNAFAAGVLGASPAPYLRIANTVVDAQFWGRDPGFSFPDNSTLTDAVEFLIGP
jgi:hypothetical protein